MAEERLIDDDKDRKYKIRKNEDGEEELVIDTDPDGEEEVEEIGFEVPELDGDDEEAAVMTPEQLAAREKARKEAEEKKRAQLSQYAEKAKSLLDDEKFEDAVYVLEGAEELDGNDCGISLLKLRALTKNFTDFSAAEECTESLSVLKSGEAAEVKAELSAYDASLKNTKTTLEGEVETLNKENEEKKDERRITFKARRKKALVFFAATVIPLIVFGALAIYYGVNMHAIKGGANIPYFIAFAVVAGVFLIASLIAVRMLWQSENYIKRNEKNTSTKLGRELEGKRAQLALVNGLLEVLGNDIS